MNYHFLLPTKPLPGYFKKISILIIAAIIVLGLYLKFAEAKEILGFTSGFLKWFLLIALVVFISSKNKIEDERTMELQLQIIRIGFRYIVGIILLIEFAIARSQDYSRYQILFYWLVSILGFQAVFLELLKNSNLIDLIEKNRFFYNLSFISTMLIIMFFNQWLWEI